LDLLHKGNYDPGGFAQYIRVPRENVEHGTYVLPDSVSYEEATMIEPLACAVRGLRVIRLQSHHTVLVLGSGVSGLLNIRLAKLSGARVIATDIDPYRLKKAAEYGADQVVNAKDGLGGIKADRVILCTGAASAGIAGGASSLDASALTGAGAGACFGAVRKSISMRRFASSSCSFKGIANRTQEPPRFTSMTNRPSSRTFLTRASTF